MRPDTQIGYCEERCLFRQRGVGLPFAIFILVILGMLSVALWELSSLAATSSTLQVQNERAGFAAQSGVEAAAAFLDDGPGPNRRCNRVPSSVNFTVDGLRGCRAVLNCVEDRDGPLTIFTLTASGECGSGDEQTIQQAELRIP